MFGGDYSKLDSQMEDYKKQVEELLPSQYLNINLSILGENKRKIDVTAKGEKYEKIVGEL